MVDPVAGIRDFYQAAICDGLVARVVFGDGQKTFEASEKQHGAGNAAEKLDRILHVMAIGRNSPRIIIEFP